MSKCCHNAVTMSTPSVRFLFVRFSRAPATVVAVAANQLVAHPSLVSGHRIRERHDNVTKTSRASDRSGTRPRCFPCGRCDVTSQGAGTIRRIAAMVDLVEELDLERDQGRGRDTSHRALHPPTPGRRSERWRGRLAHTPQRRLCEACRVVHAAETSEPWWQLRAGHRQLARHFLPDPGRPESRIRTRRRGSHPISRCSR